MGDEWFGHYLKDEKVGQHRSFRPDGTIQISEHKAKKTFGKLTLYATDGSISNMILLNGDVQKRKEVSSQKAFFDKDGNVK